MPLVSIIIPCYNAEMYLAECLDSILSQTMDDFEIICVDDGSTDSTWDILESYAARDSRFRLLKQNNKGPGVARNRALDIAEGKYIYCIDADDVAYRSLLERCTNVFAKTDADVVVFSFDVLNDTSRRSVPAEWSSRNTDVFPTIPKTFTWHACPDLFFETVQNLPWNKMVRKQLLDYHGIRFQEINRTEDLMYALPACVCAQRIARIGVALMTHREHSGNNAMSDKGAFPCDFLYAFKDFQTWLKDNDVYEDLRFAYQTWLLDAVYYNMTSYSSFEAFARAYDMLAACDLRAFDLAPLSPERINDHRYKTMLEGLKRGSREEFLHALVNAENREIQDILDGWQRRQLASSWLPARLIRFVRKQLPPAKNS